MGKMIFGRFLPGDSIVHKMDPRAKLLFVFIFIFISYKSYKRCKYE